ncbi:MAG: GNAT family N-acetyltransferase [Gammaproteobacteria bacterium]|nr:GNAT family N-acetyltransferase [Gammaproteobacteria bacterium]
MKLKDGELRLAKTSDADAIATMSRLTIEQGLRWRWRPARVRQAIADLDTNAIVITQDGLLTGFSIAWFGQNEAHLILLGVHPSCRRRGTGAHLVKWQEKVAETAGIRTLTLEVRESNEIAREFYYQLGFRENRLLKQYYDGSEDALRMVHHL